jgi:hypothetical protein
MKNFHKDGSSGYSDMQKKTGRIKLKRRSSYGHIKEAGV